MIAAVVLRPVFPRRCRPDHGIAAGNMTNSNKIVTSANAFVPEAAANATEKPVKYGNVQPVSGSLSPIYRMVIGSLILYVFAVGLRTFFPFPEPTDTAIFLYRQDTWLLLVETALLLVVCVVPGNRLRPLDLPQGALVPIAIFLVALCYIGYKWVLCGYDMSRDEQMAVFDSRIFGAGHLVQALPLAWQPHASALDTFFMQTTAHPVAWVSAYLPMNAALRAAVGLVADPALSGPLMVALGFLALWNCARLLWPGDREAAIVALLLYACSGQVLFAGMTAFAMPEHLTFDLLWLWLFLLRRPVADIGAVLAAFVATGLHQPLFHPLFAAPILFTLLLERNWRRAALYGLGYAAICAFWLAWPGWMHMLIAGSNAAAAAAGISYFTRLSSMLAGHDPARWQEMGANLLRFFAWQHLLFLPLLVGGIALAWRERLRAAFAVSLILPVCVMTVILPWQGHGFGYRYLHGALAAAILLAVYGWRSLSGVNGWLRPLFLRATLASVFIVLPLQAMMAHDFNAPFAQIDKRITASGADYFITGSRDAPYSQDLVINRPDLSNRPIRLVGDKVDQSLILDICRSGATVLMPTSAVYFSIDDYFYLKPLANADKRIASLSRKLKAAGCRVQDLDAQ
jgi:hypothetical protein